MATTAADPVFIDTNVLIYASRPAAPQHQAAREALAHLEARDSRLSVSRQVLHEYLAVVTRPHNSTPALPMSVAIADVRKFQSLFDVADDNQEVLDGLLQLLETYPGAGKQVHDANLVATMLAHGVHRLLTFNGRDFQRFAGLIELEPLPLA